MLATVVHVDSVQRVLTRHQTVTASVLRRPLALPWGFPCQMVAHALIRPVNLRATAKLVAAALVAFRHLVQQTLRLAQHRLLLV